MKELKVKLFGNVAISIEEDGTTDMMVVEENDFVTAFSGPIGRATHKGTVNVSLTSYGKKATHNRFLKTLSDTDFIFVKRSHKRKSDISPGIHISLKRTKTRTSLIIFSKKKLLMNMDWLDEGRSDEWYHEEALRYLNYGIHPHNDNMLIHSAVTFHDQEYVLNPVLQYYLDSGLAEYISGNSQAIFY